MNTHSKTKSFSNKKNLAHKGQWLSALGFAILRLTPHYQIKNPVMFVVYVGSIFTTGLGIAAIFNPQYGSAPFILHITCWLWLTVLFANFSESMAESRGKAQAEYLRKSRRELQAKRITDRKKREYSLISATQLRKGDIVLVEKDDLIPGDGQVIEGIASVNESTITGESAPVIRESGGDRDAVTGGTLILSDWLIIQITSNPGETFLDTMIALVEGAKRQKTPNEIALNILLAGMTLIFLVVVMTLLPLSIFSVALNGKGTAVSITVLIALLVCLIPTTIGGLLSAIGIAGMDRLIRHNVIANSGRAVEAAGDVSVLFLDKTGTITMGNRQACAFYPGTHIAIEDLALAAALSSFSDDTPEGKSIVHLALDKYAVKAHMLDVSNATFIPFTAERRCSGVKFNGTEILKGAVDKMIAMVEKNRGKRDDFLIKKVEEVARSGATPLMVLKDNIMMGVIELKDIIKPGIKQRLAELRLMGIKSIMITGDNPLTAATIANEVGVDDFYAEFTPEKKLTLIRKLQLEGQLIAMVGDGTNDAPALAQTDVAVAMNSGTQAAKEAANMVDLDSDPTKLIEIVKIGKQLLMTRGALTTFSIANDIAKYFAIIPAAFAGIIPAIAAFNIMRLGTSQSAILSAVIFNALIIVFLIPLALQGASYRPMSANKLLFKNSLIYGLGGIIIPFMGIKMIDMLINALKWI